MNFTSESVMHDIEVELRNRKELDWTNTDRLLLKAQLHIASLQRQLEHRELTDEEIHDLMDEIRQAVGDDIERAMYRMARAILRKAEEK